MKTFIPSPPQALLKLWREKTVKIANTADRVIIPGNMVSLMVKDKERRGWNSGILRVITTYAETHNDATMLVGPNELVALSHPREWTNDRARYHLRSRWLQDINPPFKTATVSNGRLVTHGGLTHGQWVELGKPTDVYETAEILNKKFLGGLYFDRTYSLGMTPNYAADPIFAHPFEEFYPSWLMSNDPMPFGQILGSRSLNSEEGRNAIGSEGSPLRFLGKTSYRKFGSITLLNEQEVTSVGLRPQAKQISRLPEDESFYMEIARDRE